MDDITIGVTEYVNNILVSAQPNDQIIDITVTETVETVLLDVSTTVQEVTVTATQNVIVENITVDYVNNENNININVTDGTQDVTLNVTPTLVEINILRSGGEVNILQFNTLADFPATGSSDYFYLAKDTNKLYRWTGSAYAEISATSSPVWGQIIGTLSNQTDLQNALNLKAPIASPTFTGTVSGITKTMVGLGAVDNTSDLDKPISTATQSALNAKQPLDGDLTSIAGLTGTAGFLKKNGVNSFNLDNTTYLSSISSSDVTTALGYTPENVANKGVNSGYASLDGGGKVPSSQLPSYVDDVIEVSSFGTLPATGETGKIYITLDTNKIYRWSGSVYVEVSSSSSVWGGITGTLSNQTDLQTALDAKQDDLNGTGFVKASGTTISYDNTTYYPASNPNGYTTNVGTVTSVAMTVPSAFSVSGSPITSSGTLAVTATGDTTQYIAGDGSLVTFPTAGQSGTLVREVRNTTGATLTKGTIVYISGATGNKPTVSKAIATGDSTSAQTFGMCQANIANNANGNVVCVGDLTGLDTSAFTEGAQLYLSSTTAGAYTVTKQLAPNHLVYIGIVTRAHPTLGQVEVNIQNGYELYELHDVSITSEVNNDGLFYEASTDLWKNKSIATVLGYTPANGANYVALTGAQSIAGDKTFTGGVINDGSLYIKQDGVFASKAGYTEIFAATGQYVNFNFGAGVTTQLRFLDTLGQTFTFPDASGTIALTSDLAGYVATTGNQTIAGDKTFSVGIIADGDFYLKQDATYIAKIGYTNLFASGNTLVLNFGSTINATLNFVSVTASRSYAYPDASGTLALTSDLHNAVTIGTANGLSLSTQVLSLALASTSATGALSSTDWNTFNNKASTASLANYLPLAGGTLTGALSGTSATFSNNVTAGSTTAGAQINVYASSYGNNGLFNAYGTDGNLKLQMGGLGSTEAFIYTGASNKLSIYTGGSTSMTITSAGLVGIGTTSPQTILSIETSGVQNTVSPIITAQSTGTTYAGMYSIRDGAGDQRGLIFQNYTANVGLTEKMRITSAGLVGIGTTAPSVLLHLSGSSGEKLRLETTTSTANFIGFYTGATRTHYFGKGSGGSNDLYCGIDSSANIFFDTNATTRMTITGAGNVGINATPGSGNRFVVKGEGTTGSFNSISLQDSSANDLFYVRCDGYFNSGLKSVSPYNFSTSGRSMVVDSAGGIGYLVSTRESKTNIKSISDASFINKLNPVQFNYRKKDSKSNMFTDEIENILTFGFIADEVEKVNKDLVFYNKDNSLAGVDYNSIIAILTKSVQELNEKIKTLENK